MFALPLPPPPSPRCWQCDVSSRFVPVISPGRTPALASDPRCHPRLTYLTYIQQWLLPRCLHFHLTPVQVSSLCGRAAGNLAPFTGRRSGVQLHLLLLVLYQKHQHTCCTEIEAPAVFEECSEIFSVFTVRAEHHRVFRFVLLSC